MFDGSKTIAGISECVYVYRFVCVYVVRIVGGVFDGSKTIAGMSECVYVCGFCVHCVCVCDEPEMCMFGSM